MKIALDISPLSNAHQVRGSGFYVKYLKRALEKYFTQDKYTFFTRGQKLPKNIEVIHIPYFDPFSFQLPFSDQKKTVITIHDLTPLVFSKEFPSGIKGKVKWMIQKKMLTNFGGIITDSYASKKDIVKIANLDEKKIYVVPLAAGEEFKQIENRQYLSLVRKKYSLPDSFALYVGDVTWNKNLPRVVKAALRSNVPLVLVGKALSDPTIDLTHPWNKDLAEVRKLIKNNPSFITVGFLSSEELVAFYNLASVFVMPSLYEGFGLPILEAMASGCPVITSQGGSLPEVAEDAAYYVDAYDTESISHAIRKIVGDKQLAKKLHTDGLNQANKFSWKKTAEKTLQVYKEIT